MIKLFPFSKQFNSKAYGTACTKIILSYLLTKFSGKLNYEKKLGNLKSTTLKEAVAKEIAQKGAWFRIRKNLIRCKSCIYNSYCPPVSNFEYVIHKNNLCNIK